MSEELEYLNSVPEGYDKPRCEFLFQDRESPDCYCGLPDWEDSTAGEPRCEFHSEAKPDDLRERLEQAVAEGKLLTKANLAGVDLPAAKLAGAHLAGADLSGARLGKANLTSANMTNTDLSGADLSGANLTGADLRGAKFRKLIRLGGEEGKYTGTERAPDLRDADLRGALLTGIELDPATNLSDMLFGPSVDGRPEDKLRDEVLVSSDQDWARFEEERAQAKQPPGPRPTYARCATAYRQLKLAFQEQDDYQHAGAFFYRERWCQRRARAQAGGKFRQRAWDFALEWIAGYGEQPLLVAMWSVVAIVLFAVMQGIQGLTVAGVEGPVHNLALAFYYSCITFATVGYGDVIPSNDYSHFFATAEAGCGLVLTSLFMICLVRKFSR